MISQFFKSLYILGIVPGQVSNEFTKSSLSQQSQHSSLFFCHYTNPRTYIDEFFAVLELEYIKLSRLKFCFASTSGVFKISNLIALPCERSEVDHR
jgi:hypothetical protein